MLPAFAIFFAVPLAWLLLAPTRTDYDLLGRKPLAIGNLHNLWRAWQTLDGFGDHIFRRWMENSLLYSLSANAITLAPAYPPATRSRSARFAAAT